jgi:hypothetical protein
MLVISFVGPHNKTCSTTDGTTLSSVASWILAVKLQQIEGVEAKTARALSNGCYAARDGRKVTLPDDLKSAGLAHSEKGRIELRG